MTEKKFEIDWSKIECVRPTNNEILKFSRGQFGPYYAMQHMNWAFREFGISRVCDNGGFPSTSDLAILVMVCQQIVDDEGIVEEPEVKKKKGWWRL